MLASVSQKRNVTSRTVSSKFLFNCHAEKREHKHPFLVPVEPQVMILGRGYPFKCTFWEHQWPPSSCQIPCSTFLGSLSRTIALPLLLKPPPLAYFDQAVHNSGYQELAQLILCQTTTTTKPVCGWAEQLFFAHWPPHAGNSTTNTVLLGAGCRSRANHTFFWGVSLPYFGGHTSLEWVSGHQPTRHDHGARL